MSGLPAELLAQARAAALTAGLELRQTPAGLALHAPGRRYRPLRVDLAAQRAALHPGAQGLLRAVRGARSVVDASAGLLTDALRLAHHGCAVLALERHPTIAALALDGLERFTAAGQVLAGSLRLRRGQAGAALRALAAADRPEVVYFDPMFPDRRAGAVRRELALLRLLAGTDIDAPDTLAAARCAATVRVVVKRPRLAPALAPDVAYVVPGRTVRFDVYLPQR